MSVKLEYEISVADVSKLRLRRYLQILFVVQMINLGIQIACLFR